MERMDSNDRDFNWLTQHPRELHKRYAGQWLAVVDGRIVAAGEDGPVIYKEAQTKYPDAEITMEVVEREITNPVYGFVLLA